MGSEKSQKKENWFVEIKDSTYPIVRVERLSFPHGENSSHSSPKTLEKVSQRLTTEGQSLFVSKHSTKKNVKVKQVVNVQKMLKCEKCFDECTCDASYSSPSNYETAVTSYEKNLSNGGTFFSLNETQASMHHGSGYKDEIENNVGFDSSQHLKCELGSIIFENKVKYLKRHSTHRNSRTKTKKCLLDVKNKNNFGEYFGSRYDDKEYSCLKCSFSSKVRSSLLSHLKVHKQTTRFKCDHCSYTSKYKGNVKNHLKFHTLTQSFKCPKCPLVLKKYSRFREHLKTHNAQKNFTCNICSFSSKYNCRLQTHLLTHNKEKSFKCDKCSYAGTTIRNLNAHLRTHTNNKVYKCPKCSYSTFATTGLRRHIMAHSSERRFKCEKCSFASKFMHTLRLHIKSKHSKPFKCVKCLFFSRTKVEVIRHMKMNCKAMKE